MESISSQSMLQTFQPRFSSHHFSVGRRRSPSGPDSGMHMLHFKPHSSPPDFKTITPVLKMKSMHNCLQQQGI